MELIHSSGDTMRFDPNNKVRFRHRKEEVDLGSLFSK